MQVRLDPERMEDDEGIARLLYENGICNDEKDRRDGECRRK